MVSHDTLIGEETDFVSQRVVFTFDNNSLATLKQVKEKGGFGSLGTAVRESLTLSDTLQDQAALGFTEVIVRNPKTNQEKTIIIPSLQKALRAGKV